MGLFSGKKDVEISKIKQLVQYLHSYNSHITKWIDYFHHKHNDHDDRLRKVELELQYTPKREHISEIVSSHPKHQELLQRIAELRARIEQLEQGKAPKPNLKEKIVQQITRNSKHYVMNYLLSIIRRYEKISASQLKEMVVDEQNLCSKSTFYRLLTDLEQENEDLAVVKQGKEKYYYLKLLRKSRFIDEKNP